MQKEHIDWITDVGRDDGDWEMGVSAGVNDSAYLCSLYNGM